MPWIVSTLIFSLCSASGTFTVKRILNIRKRKSSTSAPPSLKKSCASSCQISRMVAGSFPRKSSITSLTAINPKGRGYFCANSTRIASILTNRSSHNGEVAALATNCASPSFASTPAMKSITATPSRVERSCLPFTAATPMLFFKSSASIFWTWLLVKASTAISPHAQPYSSFFFCKYSTIAV